MHKRIIVAAFKSGKVGNERKNKDPSITEIGFRDDQRYTNILTKNRYWIESASWQINDNNEDRECQEIYARSFQNEQCGSLKKMSSNCEQLKAEIYDTHLRKTHLEFL